MDGTSRIGIFVAAAGDILFHLRGKKAGKIEVFLLWMAFSGVGGTLETVACFIEALVHLFVEGARVSCIFLFFLSLDRGMSSSESPLGI